MTEDKLKDAKARMDKSIDSTRQEFAGVRTGRATPQLVDRVSVDYYGTQTPLAQLSNIAATDARTLTITPYDKSAVEQVEKGILEADLGLTPSSDGDVIRINIPDLTEERRKEMVKVVRAVAEDGRVAVRNIRHDVLNDLRKLKEEGEASEDDERRAENELQKYTDSHISKIDELLEGKEEEILRV